jgi:hypothetical protein
MRLIVEVVLRGPNWQVERSDHRARPGRAPMLGHRPIRLLHLHCELHRELT